MNFKDLVAAINLFEETTGRKPKLLINFCLWAIGYGLLNQTEITELEQYFRVNTVSFGEFVSNWS